MDNEAIAESNKLKDKLAASMLEIEKKHVRLPGKRSIIDKLSRITQNVQIVTFSFYSTCIKLRLEFCVTLKKIWGTRGCIILFLPLKYAMVAKIARKAVTEIGHVY